jgi:hypothetical protein
MWWDDQNLGMPHIDATGKRWNFRVWHEVVNLKHVARVFYWDDAKELTGVLVLPEGSRTDVAALHSVIRKLASDSGLRAKHSRDLKFPLERHYSSYGAFPEEAVG